MTNPNAEYVYQTPDNLARLGARWAARCIDFVVVVALIFIGNQAGLLLARWVNPVLNHLGDVTALIAVAYYFLCDAMPGGQSLGKRALKIRVVSDISHVDCTVMQSLVRNVARVLAIVDLIPAFFGARKRLGDMFASTVVITAHR